MRNPVLLKKLRDSPSSLKGVGGSCEDTLVQTDDFSKDSINELGYMRNLNVLDMKNIDTISLKNLKINAIKSDNNTAG